MTAEGPLTGLRVVELAEDVAGPYCGKLLANLGADVIKIEPPRAGDACRLEEPFKDGVAGLDRSGLFLYLNGGKRSVTLDVAAPAGRAVLDDLLSRADVLIHTLQPRIAASLSLDYEILAARLPRVVVTAITPYGQTGPRRDWRGTEITLWNASGYGVLTPAGAREEEEPPLHPRSAQVAYLSAANAAGATMAALLDRELNGDGQLVERLAAGDDGRGPQPLSFADFFVRQQRNRLVPQPSPSQHDAVPALQGRLGEPAAHAGRPVGQAAGMDGQS